ncbi:MAG: hypothetical protein ACPLW4_01515 [Nitrososphaeria archaeon]
MRVEGKIFYNKIFSYIHLCLYLLNLIGRVLKDESRRTNVG